MALLLQSFPRFYHPAFGTAAQLPVTRDGVHGSATDSLVASGTNCFAELTMERVIDGTSTTGICGLLPARAFLDGSIRPHEKTLNARLQRQRALITDDHGGLGKPILITTPNLDKLRGQVNAHLRPAEDRVTFNGEFSNYQLRELTAATDLRINTLDLSGLGTLVIADGHHRAETHASLAAAGNVDCADVPVCLVDARELTIGIFGRFLPMVSAPIDEVLIKLEGYFNIESIGAPEAPNRDGDWVMTYRDRYFHLSWKTPAIGTTASAWLVGEVLGNEFGIRDASNADDLVHVPVDVLPTGHLELPDTHSLSFCGSPVTTDTFFREVNNGGTFPPKEHQVQPQGPQWSDRLEGLRWVATTGR